MKCDESKALTAGRLVVFSEGEYSDYGYRGTYVALKDLTFGELREKLKPFKVGKYQDELGAVEPMLIREGYLLEVDMTEIHLGSYNSIEV